MIWGNTLIKCWIDCCLAPSRWIIKVNRVKVAHYCQGKLKFTAANLPWWIWICRSEFEFSVVNFNLTWWILICPGEEFEFAVVNLNLPWWIWICCGEFEFAVVNFNLTWWIWICRGEFEFAAVNFNMPWQLWATRGGLPNVGYTGMSHRPGSIFHLQKSRIGPKFLKFYSRAGPTFLKFYSRTGSLFDNLVSNTPAQMSKIPVAFLICFLQPDVFIFVLQSVSSFL